MLVKPVPCSGGLRGPRALPLWGLWMASGDGVTAPLGLSAIYLLHLLLPPVSPRPIPWFCLPFKCLNTT